MARRLGTLWRTVAECGVFWLQMVKPFGKVDGAIRATRPPPLTIVTLIVCTGRTSFPPGSRALGSVPRSEHGGGVTVIFRVLPSTPTVQLV